MTDDRRGGIALIAGAAGAIVTMSIHPSGHDLFAPDQFATMARLAVVAHALALATVPVSFLGAMALSRRVSTPERLALAALVTYAFASVAVMSAAVVSGLVGPTLVRRILAAEPEAKPGWEIAFRYNGLLNQAFARVYVVASAAAIVLWSASILRSGALARGVGICGCLVGPAILIALLSGHLTLGVHGFGLVVLAQASWFIAVGTLLCRFREA
jgi:hypothetical protein